MSTFYKNITQQKAKNCTLANNLLTKEIKRTNLILTNMKIPSHAKLAFKGIIYDIYQWEQKLFDGTTATFEGLRRPDSSIVVATKGGKILLAKEVQPGKKPFWGFFGGRIEKNETPLKAAKRELLEETGLASKNWTKLFTYNMPHSKWSLNYFLAKDCEKIQEQNLDGGERIKVHEFNFEEFKKILMRKDFREQLLKLHLLSDLSPEKLNDFKKKLQIK